MTKPPHALPAPRGFCAGVDRAIKIVEMALEKWGAPVYVRHEIVHNRFVVDGLRDKGAVFVEELAECPDDRPVIFSAHGVPKAVPAEAAKREMLYVDATCPLVSKVHIEAERHHANGLQMIMIGHEGHPETEGTMGQLPKGEVLLVETADDVATVTVRDPDKLAYVTQTTLSVDDTAEIVAALQARFPAIVGPHKEDICYATTNRQEAVKAVSPKIDALLVIGAPNSSNSKRLVEVGRKAGCAYAQLVQRAGDIDWRALYGITSIGITAGASAPEVLVNEVIDAFRERFDVTVDTVETAQENVEFKVPRVLRSRHDLLQFIATAFVVVIAPGTGVIYTLAIGLGQGRRASLAAAIGCTLGIVPHLLAAILGLAAILHTSALAFAVVKFAGVAYLLWLAWQALSSDGALSIQPDRSGEAHWRTARRGALINILNPKLSIFFLALLPPFLTGAPDQATGEMVLLGSVFMAMTFAVFALYGCFAAWARDRLLQSKTVMVWLNRGFAAVFAALAGRLALERA